MMTSYVPDQMLRNLSPQCLTTAQRREADEQLGATVAAVTRRTGRAIRRTHTWARQGRRTGASRWNLSKAS